ncbi:MAG: superoxide dismutase, Ni [Patescibacteria group bacterium]
MKLASIFNLLPENLAYAHCDIPCGIYDPHNAQMAAHTVIRMNQLIEEVSASSKEPPFEERKKIISQVSRLTHVKEEHGHLVEDELGTLQNDYFKDEHYKKFGNLRELLEKGTKLSIKVRQNIDMEAAEELLETVMQIAEIFYKSKGLESARVKAPFPTGLDIVVQR